MKFNNFMERNWKAIVFVSLMVAFLFTNPYTRMFILWLVPALKGIVLLVVFLGTCIAVGLIVARVISYFSPYKGDNK